MKKTNPVKSTVDNHIEHLIALDRFIQATRDSGYKGTGSAVAELVDNSLQAGATRIDVFVAPDDSDSDSLIIEVLDNGCGMSPAALKQALRFGGSSRFNDRTGLGRYGMGLPNSSFSQARCVEVTTWRSPRNGCSATLDLDDIAEGRVSFVPAPVSVKPPRFAIQNGFKSGTSVRWLRCDRLEFRRATTIVAKLKTVLGRVFRWFVWNGTQIRVNGDKVVGVDPLGVHQLSPISGATFYGEPLEYDIDIQMPDGKGRASGRVVVRFSELPVHAWHNLPNERKQRLGISKGAGVSIVRAGREIDFGWFFLGEKRKENYDDWWRCELRFEPGLDEVFGITHTKQQIHPTHELLQALTPDLETMAKTLNRRVRQAHEQLQTAVTVAESQRTAANRDSRLPPLPAKTSPKVEQAYRSFIRKHPQVSQNPTDQKGRLQYSMMIVKTQNTRLFNTYRKDGHVIMALNEDHPFYKRVYAPLVGDTDSHRKTVRQQIELLLLGAARAEAAVGKDGDTFLSYWSDVIATFLQ